MKNLPTAAANDPLKCTVSSRGSFVVYTSACRQVEELFNTTPERLASDIALAIEQARDSGFQQGLASVRRALGI